MKLKKFNNIKLSFMAILAFTAIVLITGCKDKTKVGTKSTADAQVVDYYDIVGKVVSTNDDPIEHVFIDAINIVMSDGSEPPSVATVRSDGNGDFGLRISSDNQVRQVTLRFTFQDYVTYVRDVVVTVKKKVDLGTITLTPMSQKTIRDSTIENTLTDNVMANAYVTIGANALTYSDGKPFTTAAEVGEDEDPITATVAIGYIDTTSNPESFPGNFYSMVGGSLKLFSTYGVLEIKVTTDNGNKKLKLAAGQTAAISIPVGDLVNTNSPDFPATADLWYYNEDTSAWVLEQKGGLTYDAATRSFTGIVSHFSTYNAGYTFETKYIQTAVYDDRGERCLSGEYDENDECIGGMEPYLLPLRDSTLEIFSDSFSPYGVWNATYTAGEDGKIPDRMNPSLSGLIYNDADGYFLPVPGNGNLMSLLKYKNPRNDKEGSKGPELIAFEEGAIKASHVYALPLSTSAYITGEVYYENGEPATGAVFMFNNPAPDGGYSGGIVDEEGKLREAEFSFWTWAWTAVPDGEAVVPVTANINTYVMVPSGAAATGIKEAHWNNLSGPPIDEPFDLNSEKFAGFNLNPDDYGVWEDSGSIVLESPALNETLNIYIVLRDPPGDVVYTHLRGAIDLKDLPSGVDPDDLWVVINGTFNDRFITVRAPVDADGNWPAGDGTFRPVTVDGVEGFFIKVPADTDLRITVGDYVTNPLSPKIYATYDYKSKDEFIKDQDGNIIGIVTTDIVLAKNTYVSGTVIWKDKPARNLKVVLENLTDTSKDDITIITEAGGVIPQTALPFSTNYRMTIWTVYPDTTNSHELIYTHPTVLKTSATGGAEKDIILELDFGVPDPETGPFIPVVPADMAAIVGTILDAEGNPATGTEIWVSPEGDFGPNSIAAIVGDNGELSQLEVYMGDVLHEGFVVLDPTVDYYEIREGFTTILADVVTPGAGVVEYLSLATGAPNTNSYIKGLIVDAEGNPATGTEIWVSPNGDFGPTSLAATVGDNGELSQLEVYMGDVLHEGFVVLDPTVDYYEIREGFATILADVETPGAGVVKTLSLTTGAANTNSYITGLVFDAEGNPATGAEIWVSPNGAFGPTSIAATVGDNGELSQLEVYMGDVLHEGFVVLDPTVAYYEIREGFTNILVDVVTPDAGVMETLSLSLPVAP